MKNKFIGSDFDNFLESEGILEEAEVAAIKRIIAYQLQQEMKIKNISQKEMAERLKTSRTALKRLLDPNNYSMTLLTLSRLAHALDKKLEIILVSKDTH